MLATVKFHISADPVQICLLGTKRQMPRAILFARHLEQAPPCRHIITVEVLHDTTAISPQGNQEDVRTSSALCTAFDAIRQPLLSSNKLLGTHLVMAHGSTESAPLSGMTINERLFARGLLGKFDAAARRRDRDTLLLLLREVELSDVD